MKKKSMLLLALPAAFLLALGSRAVFGTGAVVASEQTFETKGETPSGSILLVGSTSMEALATALAEGYMESRPQVRVSTEFTGSGAGIEAVLGGSADIGNASRPLKQEEKEAGAAENVVAIDGIVVCTDPQNTVTNLTMEQLTDIYTGAVRNWAQVGGPDAPIVVVGREAGSGTRSAFEELLGIEEQCAYANELDSTGAVKARVSSTPGAIGYVSLDVADETLKILSLDGVQVTEESMKTGRYLLCRPFVMATRGQLCDQSPLVRDWFAYVLGEEGQKIASSVGLVTVR